MARGHRRLAGTPRRVKLVAFLLLFHEPANGNTGICSSLESYQRECMQNVGLGYLRQLSLFC